MVAQVGGEVGVHAGRPDLVEEAVARIRRRPRRCGPGRSGSPATRSPAGGAGQSGGGLPRRSRRGAAGASARRSGPVPRRPAGSVGSGTSGPVTRRPTAAARASETPGSARSALVWATCRAMPFLIRSCTTRPLKPVAATVVVPRRYSGWWVTSRSAPIRTASSATSRTGSTAKSTRPTSASGSPQTRPTASHDSARSAGQRASRASITSDSLGTGEGYLPGMCPGLPLGPCATAAHLVPLSMANPPMPTLTRESSRLAPIIRRYET